MLIDEETITEYRGQDGSLVTIRVSCCCRRTDCRSRRWNGSVCHEPGRIYVIYCKYGQQRERREPGDRFFGETFDRTKRLFYSFNARLVLRRTNKYLLASGGDRKLPKAWLTEVSLDDTFLRTLIQRASRTVLRNLAMERKLLLDYFFLYSLITRQTRS